MECNKCGKINYATATVCVMCGSPLEPKNLQNDSEDHSDENDFESEEVEQEDNNAQANAAEDPEPPKRSKKTGLIIGVIALVLIIAIALFYFSSSSEAEVRAGFRIENQASDTLYVNQEYIFTDTTQGATQWLWDFGNGVTSKERYQEVYYSTPGQFNVTLLVDGQYQVERKLFLVEALIEEDTVFVAPPIAISGIDKTYKVNESIVLMDNTEGATATSWMNESDGIMAGVNKELTLKFDYPGTYKYSVTNSVYSSPFYFELTITEPKKSGGGEKKVEKPVEQFDDKKALKQLNEVLSKVYAIDISLKRKRTDAWFDGVKAKLKGKEIAEYYFQKEDGSTSKAYDFGEKLKGIGTDKLVEITKVELSSNMNKVNVYFKEK